MSSNKKLCWVIGGSVEEYSLSPGMHKVIYDVLGLKDWEYKAKNIADENELENFLEMVRKDRDIVGFNVTTPYKQIVTSYLDDIAPEAKLIRAVNTVVNEEGKLTGYNTDWNGFYYELRDNLDVVYHSFSSVKSALILGAGGASRAVVWCLANQICKNVYVYDIDKYKSNLLEKELTQRDCRVRAIDEKDIKDKLAEADILINATNVGILEGDPSLVSFKGKKGKDFKETLKVYDLVYNRKTELIKEAEKAGLRASGGIGMLAAQGARAFSLWAVKHGVLEQNEETTREIIEKMKLYLIEEVSR
ncbi:MAG: shikimate dehydrogenase [Elusimicrobia bacterium]|nr:shikimate dehydrogenase [Elusimicrobiota bacterium]